MTHRNKLDKLSKRKQVDYLSDLLGITDPTTLLRIWDMIYPHDKVWVDSNTMAKIANILQLAQQLPEDHEIRQELKKLGAYIFTTALAESR